MLNYNNVLLKHTHFTLKHKMISQPNEQVKFFICSPLYFNIILDQK